MKYDFETTVPREGMNTYKYEARKDIFGRADVLPLWVADHDFAIPPCVAAAIRERALHDVYGYEIRGASFNVAIADWIGRRNGWKIRPEWIVFTPGVVSGLVFGINAFSKPGDRIVIQPPVYPPFAHCIKDNGRIVVNNPLVQSGDSFTIDFDDLDRKLVDAKIMILCNPQNPTGRVFTGEELARIGELCEKHDVRILSDEIHSDLIMPQYKHTHIASLSPETAARTVTLIAPSKTFNLAGLASSAAIIPDKGLRKMFRNEIDRLHVGLGNSFGNVAMEAAYRCGDDWLDQFITHISSNIEYVHQFLADNMPKIRSFKVEGTYLMWLDMTGLGLGPDGTKDFVINKAGLGLNDGRDFGTEGACHMRMNVAAPRKTLEQAMRQLQEAYMMLNL